MIINIIFGPKLREILYSVNIAEKQTVSAWYFLFRGDQFLLFQRYESKIIKTKTNHIQAIQDLKELIWFDYP